MINPKYQIGDMLYYHETDRYYIIEDIITIGYTTCYKFFIMNNEVYNTVEVDTIHVDGAYRKVA